jgi:hypothetical protein
MRAVTRETDPDPDAEEAGRRVLNARRHRSGENQKTERDLKRPIC